MGWFSTLKSGTLKSLSSLLSVVFTYFLDIVNPNINPDPDALNFPFFMIHLREHLLCFLKAPGTLVINSWGQGLNLESRSNYHRGPLQGSLVFLKGN